jgi:hypothetical protein
VEGAVLNRARTRAVVALLTALVLVNAAFVAHFGLRMHALVIYDEKFAVEGARWLHGDLHRLIETPSYGGRGIERLTAMLFVPGIWLFGSTAHQFVFDHLAISLLFALQAVPAYLLARGLGVRPGWALFAGAFAVFGPWAVVGTVLLNNVPASCAAAFALWAMWRSITTPSPWWDGLAVLLVLLATLARVSTAVLALAFPVAIAGHAIVAGRGQASPGQVALETVRRHWLAVALGAVAVVAVAAGGAGRFEGEYAHTSVGLHPGVIGTRLLTTFTHLAAGSGVVALVIGGAWLVRQLVSPRSPAATAFAVLALMWVAGLLWVNMASGVDERYELPLFVPLAVAFAVALARAEVALLPTIAAGLVCWFALHRHGPIGYSQSSDYLTWPSREWLSLIWADRLQSTLSLSRQTAIDLIALVALVVSVAVAVARGPWAKRLRVAVAAFALVFAVGGSAWAMAKLSGFQRPGASFDGTSFIDKITGGQPTAALRSTVETDANAPLRWGEIQYFNAAAPGSVTLEAKVPDLCCGPFGIDQVATVDHATGAAKSDTPLPVYIATTPEWLPAGFAAQPVAASSLYNPPVTLERLKQPPMAAWLSHGFDAYGWVRPQQRASLRVFPAAAAAPACLRATLLAPTGPAPIHWRIGRATGSLAAGAQKRLDVPLHGTAPENLPVTAAPPGRDPFSRRIGLIGLSNLRVSKCGAAEPSPVPDP